MKRMLELALAALLTFAAASFAVESPVVYYVGSNSQNDDYAYEIDSLVNSSSDYRVVFLHDYFKSMECDTAFHAVVPSIMMRYKSENWKKMQLHYVMKNGGVAWYERTGGATDYYCVDFEGNGGGCVLDRIDAITEFSLAGVYSLASVYNGFEDGDSLSLIFTPVEELGLDNFKNSSSVDYSLYYDSAIESGDISVVAYGTDVRTGELLEMESAVVVDRYSASTPQDVAFADKMQVKFVNETLSPYYEFKGFKVWLAFTTDGNVGSARDMFWDLPEPGESIADYVKNVVENGYSYPYEFETDADGYFSLRELLDEVYAAAFQEEWIGNRTDVVFALRVFPVFEPVVYNVTFDNNTDATVFYSGDYLSMNHGDLVFNEGFAYPVFRADGKCFAGWSFDPKGEESALYDSDAKVDAEWIDAYESGKYTLYAVWKDRNNSGEPCGSVKVPLYTDGNGVLELYQVVENTGDIVRFEFDEVAGKENTYQIALPDAAAMNDYYTSIPFVKKSVPKPDYVSYRDSLAFTRMGENVTEIFEYDFIYETTNPDDVLESFSAKFVPKGPYTVSFDLGPRYKLEDLYVVNVNSFDEETKAVVQDSLPMLCTVFDATERESYCTYRWEYAGPSAGPEKDRFTLFDGGLYDLAKQDGLLNGVIPLKLSTTETAWFNTSYNHVAIVSEDYENGSVKLVQKINGNDVQRKIGSDSLLLSGAPTIAEGIEYFSFDFGVVAEPDDGYMLEGPIEVGVTPASTGNTDYEDLENGAHYKFEGNINEESIAYSLKAKFVGFRWMSLDFNTDDNYFVWLDENAGMRQIPNSDTRIELPSKAYTSETCLLGWSFDEKATKFDYSREAKGAELFKEMEQDVSGRLYAVWGDMDACGIRCKPGCDFDKNGDKCCEGGNDAGTLYVVARLESEHGTVEFVDEDNGKRIHSFNKNGEMLLPYDGSFNGVNLKFRAVPDNGYKLDSLVYTTRGGTGEYWNLGTEGSLTYYLGLDAVFTAYYSKTGNDPDPDLPGNLGEPVLELSGNFVRFTYPADSVKPGMRLVGELLADYAEDPVRNFMYEDGKAGADLLPWYAGPLNTGFYLLNVWLVEGSDSTLVYSRDFEVESRIAVDCPDCWYMVSLYNVDFEKFGWAGNPVFYWWDESRNYGHYWQYQDFTEGSEVDPVRGYWYNSDEGLALDVKDKYEYPENSVWHLENVYTGWNMVANPYGWSVEIMDHERRKQGGGEDFMFMRWNPVAADYEPVDVIGPYEAVWVHVDESVEWRLPSEPVFTDTVDADGNATPSRKAPKPAALAKAAGIGEWSIQASLADNNGKTDAWNVMGVGESAKIALEPPAGLGSRVNFSIVEGGMGMMKSIKAATDASEYEWTVELSASTARTGHLSFAGVDALRASGLRLFVTVDGNTTEMTEGKPLNIALGEKVKVATVRAAPTARTVVASKLNGLRAVRVADRLLVDFSATEGLAGANARVELLDVNGNVVGNAELSAAAGANTVSLVAPRHGLYIVRVRCASQTAVLKIVAR